MKLPAPGPGPAWLAGLFVGRPLVASLVTSFRVDATRIGEELGCAAGASVLRRIKTGVVRVLADGS